MLLHVSLKSSLFPPSPKHFLKETHFKTKRSYSDFNVSPLAEPLLTRFGWSEFRHLFTVQLQNTGGLMSHHLGKRIPHKKYSRSFSSKFKHVQQACFNFIVTLLFILTEHFLQLSTVVVPNRGTSHSAFSLTTILLLGNQILYD